MASTRKKTTATNTATADSASYVIGRFTIGSQKNHATSVLKPRRKRFCPRIDGQTREALRLERVDHHQGRLRAARRMRQDPARADQEVEGQEVIDSARIVVEQAERMTALIRQLLDFSCGLDPGFFLHADDPGNRDTIAISLPQVAEPGTVFIYGPSALQVFHEVLKVKLKGESPTHFLERRVLRRLGLGSQRYLKDRAGNPLLASGWALSARQWSQMGELVLHGGSPVVSSGSLAQCWRGSPANRAFSLGWWNNRAAPGGREFDFENMLVPKWPQQNWSGACLCSS